MRIHRKVKPFHIDVRGTLSHLLEKEEPITSALFATCKKGAIRANHYHKKDTHHTYLIKGSMEYSYKDAKDPKARKKTITVKSGEIITSPPMTMHAMKFLEDSSFIALTTEPRSQKDYEKDTVRVQLIK